MRRTMSASLGFRRDNTPPSAHQTPVWLEILCDKSTRSVRSLGRQPAKTAPPHRSDHERRPLEAVDVSNIVQGVLDHAAAKRGDAFLDHATLLSEAGLLTPRSSDSSPPTRYPLSPQKPAACACRPAHSPAATPENCSPPPFRIGSLSGAASPAPSACQAAAGHGCRAPIRSPMPACWSSRRWR